MALNYKKYIRNQNFRFFLLKCLSFIPDRIMVALQYRIKTGRALNLKNPQRFTEKLQWYKVYYRNPLMHQCVDKYEVRKYIIEKGHEDILNECYGIYNDASEINFSKLPDKFVIKTTDGTGGQNVLICKDKSKLNIPNVVSTVNKWLNKKDLNPGREWAYTGIRKSRILVEKFIESNIEEGGLIDYKFFCFNGRIDYLYVIADRDLGDKAGLAVYNTNFERIDVQRLDEKPLSRNVPKPKNFEQMLDIAKDLSIGFPHVRMDFYNINGKILFGEFTFYDGSGYMLYNPDSFDFALGEHFILPVNI